MGQKINPHVYRLNVPHRGRNSLLFRDPKLLGINFQGHGVILNPSQSADFLGWEDSIQGRDLNERSYSDYLGLLHHVGASVKERVEKFGRIPNRLTSVLKPSRLGMTREVQVQWVPRNAISLTKKDYVLFISSLKQRERSVEKNWLEVGGNRCQMGGLRRCLTSVNLIELASKSDHWQGEVQTRLEKQGVLKEEEDRKKERNRFYEEDRFDEDGNRLLQGKDDLPSLFSSSPLKAAKPIGSGGLLDPNEGGERVTQRLLIKAFMLAGVYPVSALISRRLAYRREDSESQRKALREVETIRELTSSSKEYGLIHHEVDSSKLSVNYGLVAKGGYRGCRLMVKGRLDGSRRTRTERIQLGILPLSTRSSPRCWAHSTSLTKYGSIGVDVNFAY